MGMTIAEKILARASGRDSVSPGEIVVVKVDTAVHTIVLPPAERVKHLLREEAR